MLNSVLFRERTVASFIREVKNKNIKNPQELKKLFMAFAEKQVRESVFEFYNNVDFILEEIGVESDEENSDALKNIASVISLNKSWLNRLEHRIKNLEIEESTLEICLSKAKKKVASLIISLNRKETVGYVKIVCPLNPTEEIFSFDPKSEKDTLNKVSQAIELVSGM